MPKSRNACRYPMWASSRETGEVVQISCSSWRCPAHGPRHARRVARVMRDTAAHWRMFTLMTFTLDPVSLGLDWESARKDRDVYDYNREYSYRFLRRAWARWRSRFFLERGFSFKYIAVVEFQRSGMAHLHVACNLIPPLGRGPEAHAAFGAWVREFRQWWRAATRNTTRSTADAIQLDVNFMPRSRRVSSYLAKYLAKHVGQDMPGRMRRYSFSRATAVRPVRVVGQWHRCEAPGPRAREYLAPVNEVALGAVVSRASPRLSRDDIMEVFNT